MPHPDSEIPNFRWDRVRNSVHLGRIGDRVTGEVTIVKSFRAHGKEGICLGIMAVSDIGEWFKWFTYDKPWDWRAGRRVYIRGNNERGAKITRHDTNPETGLKTNVLADMKEAQIEVIGV